MATTTTRVSGAVSRMLEAGQISRVDEATGVLQALVADCPDDGNRATVRRMTRELGGPVMEVIMRCPVCFKDFVAGPGVLYLYPAGSGGGARKAAAGSAKAVKAGAAKGSAKSAKAAKSAKSALGAKLATSAKMAKTAKAATRAAKPAAKGSAKSAKKAGTGRASKGAKKTGRRR